MKYMAKLVFILFSLLLIMAFTPASQPPSIAAAAGPPDDLERLHQRMLPLFEIDGVVFTDANELTNRLLVAVENKGLAKSVEQRLRVLGISVDLVDIVEADPFVELDTLQDYVRPTQGGIQIQYVKKPWLYSCTVGFNSTLGGVDGFVVNSHCTAKRGTVDNTTYYQPTTSSTSNIIGTEIADPPFFTSNGCPKGKQCRYSDAAFAKQAIGVTAALGSIAQIDTVNTGSLTINGSYQITGEATTNATVGQTLNKVGRTTGWTQGAVTNSNVNVAVSGSKIVLIGQDIVAAGSGGGDSGSPVFSIDSNNQVTLYGILWGGNSAGTNFVYSPIYRVEQDLGLLTTY